MREGTFFKSKVPLGLGKLVWFLFSWATKIHVTWQLTLSPRIAVDWGNFIRDICAEDVRRNLRQLGGFDNNGQPIVVEIDESYFFRRKFHRGRRVNGLWVFAAIERDSGLCMMEVVPDRTAQTLVPLVQQWCLPGTHIISDG